MNVELKNGTIETLATNLTNEEFNSDELKLLYGKRWTIETGFDKTEKFGSNRRVFPEHGESLLNKTFMPIFSFYNLEMLAIIFFENNRL